MKKLYLLLFFINTHLSNGQNFNLKIEGSTKNETKTIDSINYLKKHKDISSIISTIKEFDSTLTKFGYFEYFLVKQTKINDSTFLFNYNIGEKTSFINIYIGENKTLLNLKKDTISIPIQETQSWIQHNLNTLEQKGFSLAKIQLTNQNIINNHLTSDLIIKLNSKRTFDELIILGYNNFPKNIKTNFNKKLKNKTFNQDLVSTIYKDLNQFNFVNQKKYPEILFTKDSTKIFTYLEKSKPNKFDGFIGFSNDKENNLTFNGYLDLSLHNILNSAEKFNLYWKNDGNNQTSFFLNTEIPYLFKTSFGIKANLKIFKQDSLFQNTQSKLDLGYYFTLNKKIHLGIQNTTSVDIQNINTNSLSNYKSKFYTLTFEYSKKNKENFFYPEKTFFSLNTGIGNRKTNIKKEKQFFIQLEASHIINLNQKNTIFIKNQSFYLESSQFVINELYRFGGINSIRGFRENSLQANTFMSIISEYRYLLSPTIHIHSILDYGYIQDKTSKLENQLLGIGIGFEILTKNGLFHLIYSNGSTKNQAIKLSNSIIQISFKTNF